MGAKLKSRVVVVLAGAALAVLGFAGAAVATGGQEPLTTDTQTAPGSPTGGAQKTDGAQAVTAAGGVPICGHDGRTTLVFGCTQYTQAGGRHYYQVPGGGTQQLHFEYVYKESAFSNELAAFRVDDVNGTINGIAPGTAGWTSQVASRSPQVIFASGSSPASADATPSFQGGDVLGFRFIAGGTVYYSFPQSNPDGVDHMLAFQHADGQTWELAWEDQSGGGDRDFNDGVYTIASAFSGPRIEQGQTFGCDFDVTPGVVEVHAYNPTRCDGEPVNTFTGAYSSTATDAALPGSGLPFAWVRSYTSLDTRPGRLGPGWTDSYDVGLELQQNGDVIFRAENGQRIRYRPQADGTYKGAAGARSTLQAVSGGYELVRVDQVRYRFDAQGRVTSIRDRNGRGPAFAYGAAGLATITDAGGRQVTITHNAAGLLERVSLPDGRFVQYGYTSGRLTSVRDLRGGVTNYRYDAAGHLDKIVDQNGNTVVENVYAGDRVVSQLDGEGNRTTFAWDAATQRATVTDARGKQRRTVYDNGLLEQEIDPLGNVTSYAYDDDLNTTGITGPRGTTITMGYDARHNLVRRTAPLGFEQTFTYGPQNNLLTSTDGRGGTTSLDYDAAGNVVRVTNADPDGPGPQGPPVTQYAYDANGLLTRVTDPLGKATTFQYDAAGDPVRTTSPLGNVTTMEYDATGRLVARVDPRGNAAGADPAQFRTTYAYDDGDGLTKVTDPLGDTTTSTYDATGRLTSTTDANGHRTTYAYDRDNRLVSVKAPDDAVTAYAYDAAGNLVRRTDANGHVTTYAFDDANRLVGVTSPLDGTWTYAYDAAGNRTQVVDANGNASPAAGDGTITYSYDALDRVVAVDYSDSTPDVSFGYDAVGNRTSMTDQTGVESFTYDPLNRLTGVARGSDSFAYGYDLAGRLLSRTYPGGAVTAYGYDDDGRLTGVTADGATTAYSYDPAGNLVSTGFPAANGYREARSYDRAGRLVELATTRAGADASEAKAPDGLPEKTNLNGSLGDVQDDPGAPDALWLTATSTGVNTSARVTFPTPSRAVAGVQTFRALVRKQGGSATPTARIDLYENGTLKASGTSQNVTSASGQVLVQTFNADSIALADRSGAGLEARLVATKSGSGSTTAAVDLGAIRWQAAFQLPTTLDRFTYTLDPVGNPTKLVTPTAATTYGYDARDRLTSACAQADPCASPTSPFIRWAYDGVGNRLSESRPDGTTTYTYDAGDELTTATKQAVTYAQHVRDDGAQPQWRLGETSGTTFASTGGTDNGTWSGAPTLGDTGAIAGDGDKAVKLNGSSQYGSVPDSDRLDQAGAFSIEAWVRRTKDKQSQAIAGKPLATATATENYALWLDTANKLRFEVGAGAAVNKSVKVTSANAVDLSWHHVVGTYAAGVAKLYVDGTLSASVTASGFTLAAANASPLQIGRAGTSSYYGGSLDELALYPVALTAAQVADHYGKGASTPPNSTTTYAYDKNGNRVQAADSYGQLTLLSYDLANRLTSIGPPTPEPVQCGEVCLAPGGGDTPVPPPYTRATGLYAYTYDGEGNRLDTSKQFCDSMSGTCWFDLAARDVWDLNGALPQLALERDGESAELRRYTQGLQPLALTSAGLGRSYFHTDRLGSVRDVTSADGVPQWSYDYEPYGASTSETRLTASAPTNPVRFAGQNLDATGLYHLHAREYEPATGRFLTTDPLPQALSDPYVSAYAYVAGRPTAWLDPSGLRWCWKACPVTDFVTEHHREVLAVGTVAACGFVTAGTCLAVALAAAATNVALDARDAGSCELSWRRVAGNAAIDFGTIGVGKLIPSVVASRLIGKPATAVYIRLGEEFNGRFRAGYEAGLAGTAGLAGLASEVDDPCGSTIGESGK